MASLRSLSRAAGIPLSAGMRSWTVFSTTTGLQALVEANFTGLTPGNALKWSTTEPTQNTFSFTDADLFATWADARAMPLRCHVLVWHTSLPAWVASAVNASTWDDIINAHIQGVLGHFPNRGWDIDVVNEAFNEADGLAGGLRNTLWRTAAGGGDYIPWSFERARVHAPAGRLFLAEFGIEQAGQDTRRNNLIVAVDDWLSQDVPIDGVAMQCHLKMDLDLDKPALRGFIQELRGLGLAVTISEFDVRNISTLGLSDTAAFAYIGDYARQFLTTAVQSGVSSIVAWGVSPDDWSATGVEQIESVPFGDSPGYARTSIAAALASTFQAQALTRPDKELVVVVELEAAV